MDSAPSSDELEKMKERMKVNFFQVEKRIAEDDARIDNLEKTIKSGNNFGSRSPVPDNQQSSIDKLTSQFTVLTNALGNIQGEIDQVKAAALQTSVSGKDSVSAEKLSLQVLELGNELKTLRVEVAQAKANLQKKDLQSENTQVGAANDLKADLKIAIQQAPEFVEVIDKIRKDRGEIDSMKIELANDRTLYTELKSAVLASIEKFGELETKCSKGIEGCGAISAAVEPSLNVHETVLIGTTNDLKSDLKTSIQQTPEFIEVIEQIKRDRGDLDSMRLELANDRKLYIELKSAVLASIEKFGGLEAQLSSNIDGQGISSKNIGNKVQMPNSAKECSSRDMDKVKTFINKVPDLEEMLEQIKKDGGDLDSMRLELTNDRKLYIELRSAVMASIEKFGGLEKEFSRSLEDIGKISRSVENTRQTNENLLNQTRSELATFEKSFSDIKKDMREETKDEITRLEAESVRLEQAISEADRKTRNELYQYIEESFGKQNNMIASYGEQVKGIGAQVSRMKRDIVEKTIDEEMNKLLVVLNGKLKDFSTKEDFDAINADMRRRLELIRSPELKPLEARMSGIETDINELKKLLRGMSQRLPVIME